jgi:rhamnosyltransferase subunit B
MHVIIAAIGTSGDTLPLIELGQHLMRSGHEVEFIGLAYFANRAQQAGLPFHSAGPTNLFEEMARDPTVWDWHVGFRSLWKVLGAAMADTFNTINQLRRVDSVLVGSSGTVGVRLAQEKFGLRAMTVHMSPFYFFSREQNCLGGLGAWPRWLPHLIRRAVLNVIDRFYIDGVCVNDVNALRRLIGLPPQRHIFTRWINSPDRIICAVPAWFANSQADWPVNAVSTGFPVALTPELWAPSASLAAFLADGDPPIVVSACTGAGAASTFFQRAIAAARITNQRVILVTRFQDQIPTPLPAFAFLIDYAPFDKLFPHARAIIHNGGIGTMALAMRARLPQIIVPFAYDQFFNGMRLALLGGGAVVRRSRPPEDLANAMRNLLESKNAAHACAELQMQTVATSDGLRDMTRALESLALAPRTNRV